MIPFHLIAFVLGFVLDLLIGDPHSIPHPVQLIGKLISVLDRKLQAKAERKAGKPDRTNIAGNANENAAENSRYKAAMPDERHPKEKIRILKRRYGRWMAAIVVLVTAGVAALILAAGYRIHPILGCALEAVMTCQILAGRSLEKESMKVYACLQDGWNTSNVPSEKPDIRLQAARKAVSMIVGRDSEHLSAEQVIKATVETVAESTSDGVIAPMLYTALGGPVLGWAYKAVNTMDSMVGYQNERYLDFGRGPAHLDDAANYLPSRISAILMIAAAWILSVFLHLSGSLYLSKRKNSDTRKDHTTAGIEKNHISEYHGFDAANAWRIWKRDRRNHASPNAAQTESAMAGALRLQLAGPAYYGGKLVKKPYIGDPLRKIEAEDIPRANQLMFGTAALCELICIGLMRIVL